MQSMSHSTAMECLGHDTEMLQSVCLDDEGYNMLAIKTAGQALRTQQFRQELHAGKQITKRCHWEYDLFHESTWVVGNKQQREVWQLIIDRRQGSHKTTACIETKRKEKREKKTTPFGINVIRSQVLYRATQSPPAYEIITTDNQDQSHKIQLDNAGCSA